MRSFFISILVLLSLNSAAQKNTPPKVTRGNTDDFAIPQLNIPQNKVFEITTHSKDEGTYGREEIYTYAFKSLGKNREGNNVLEGKIVRAYIYDVRSGTTLLNTDSIRNTGFLSTIIWLPLAMLNKPFTVVVSQKGEMIGLNGIQQTLQEIISRWHISDLSSKYILNDGKRVFSQAIANLFFNQHGSTADTAVTDYPFDKGNSAPFKITGKSKGTVTVQSIYNSDGNESGRKYILDTRTGLIKSGVKTQDIRFKTSPQPGYAANTVIKLKTMVTLTSARLHPLPDTAWVNMAAGLSNYSNCFTKGIGFDKIKIRDFINSPDPRFLNDRYYISARLRLARKLQSDDTYDGTYDSLLLSAPNRYIANDEINLWNKLNLALSMQGAAEAYEVSKYAYKIGTTFDDWLQSNFSTDVKNNNGEASIKKNYELLALFKTNEDPKYIRKTTPLYLWAMAEKRKSDSSFVIETAKVFKNMDDQDMLAGNGGRYALLVYRMLIDTKQQVQAKDLLVATITKLERFTADTLNERRYADKNLLAGAWYFKYLAEEAAADPNATQSLAQAVKYSPVEQKEKVHISTIDRGFLNTKESYRELFFERLLSSGNEAAALKMFAEHVTAMPESIEEMKGLFAKKFPGKDFKVFFNTEIIGLWPVAPAFMVKGIDGKQHNLAQYKDKWLLIDFWGTWCSPCRAEMPVVNNFSTEVTAGKYQNVNFLSIACSDTEARVKAYLKDSKFMMPTALSDGAVERNYKILHYPTKVIIAPNGRMITMESKDWETVIKNFSQL